jgi:hypothetical protein
MSAVIGVSAIGVGASIFGGISAGNAAKQEREQQLQMYQNNQAIAQQVKAQEQPAINAEQNLLGEYQSKNLTPESQIAQDQFKANTAQTQRDIQSNAPLTGQGVAGARALTTSFNTDEGLAGISLQDAVAKRQGTLQAAQALKQTPGWATLATGANTQSGNALGTWSNIDQSNSQSAYGQAAAGLGNLAKMYVSRQQPGTDTDNGWGNTVPIGTDMTDARNS